MKYSDRITLSTSPTTNTIYDYMFRLNSAFDFDLSSTGHQPYFSDTLSTIYNRYRIYAVSYRIQYDPNGAAGLLAVLPSNDANSLSGTNASYIMELPRSKFKTLSTDQPTTITGRINLPSLNGVTSAQYKSDDRFQAQFGSNPLEQLTLHVMRLCTTTNPITMSCSFKLHCECFDPLTLGQS